MLHGQAGRAVRRVRLRSLGPTENQTVNPPVKTKKNIHFEFSQELVQEPLLYKINRSFDVIVNIRGASVTDQGGFIALELEGEHTEIERVMEYLRGQGVRLGEGDGEAAEGEAR